MFQCKYSKLQAIATSIDVLPVNGTRWTAIALIKYLKPRKRRDSVEERRSGKWQQPTAVTEVIFFLVDQLGKMLNVVG